MEGSGSTNEVPLRKRNQKSYVRFMGEKAKRFWTLVGGRKKEVLFPARELQAD